MVEQSIKLFHDKKVRALWVDEKWFFSVVDVIEVLTDSPNPRRYWSDLKIKLKEEGSELYGKIVQLKLQSADGNTAKVAKDRIEKRLGKKIVTSRNAGQIHSKRKMSFSKKREIE